MDGVLHLNERDVCELVDLRGAIDALEQTVAAQARGEARNVPKSLATWGDGSSMHTLGSLMPERGLLGFKTWAHTPRGGGSIYSLFDAHRGALMALIEARALGQLRTSGIAGVATRAMSAPNAGSMALIGTGAQAMLQLAAVATVRDLRQVRVYSPTPEKRLAFVEAARRKFAFQIEAVATMEAATDGAEIVTLITRAREPFLNAAMLADGAHLNAVGAILPTHAEFEQDVFRRADLVVVDDLENAKRGSRELIERFGAPGESWDGVRTLGDLLKSGASVRPSPCRLSVFKGMGMGLSDLAIASLVYERAKEQGRGRVLPRAERIDPLDVVSNVR